MPAWVASNTIIWATRAHYINHVAAASQSLTRCRIGMDPDACVRLGERKQFRLVTGAHASIASQHHTSGQRGHITYTTWRAASHSLTRCRTMRDPDACVVLGQRKRRQVRGANASMVSHQQTSEQRGHMTCETLRAASQSLTGCRIKRDPDARVCLSKEKNAG